MSGYKTFAVAGAGGLGRFVVEALLAKKNEGTISSVSILSRSSSGHDDLVAKGAKVVVVDYSSSSSIKSAVTGVDVVVSTLSGSPLGPQLGLATGAKAAGVKLFVPSEFGNATDGATEGFWGEKDAFKKKLKNEIHLPYAAFYTGGFADFLFQKGLAEVVGFDFTNGKITVPGEGTSPISWTTRRDIGRFVAHVLTQLPKEKLEWRIFRIEGDRTSFNQIIEDYKARSGKNVSVAHRPRSELEEKLTKDPSDGFTAVLLSWDKGQGASGKPEELANSEFPQWKPKKVIDVILEVYGN
ncbi:hypothetical protein ACEPAF_754 [Sanghuangporus sanghuang]|uniref:NAD-binding protein n=1 Tax=Sanghuangporus baumii TaxID=108892 RepID=A0A9Q5HUW0_SANBA|nr:NAD-binding protein [Sanghuangporus baumii]